MSLTNVTIAHSQGYALSTDAGASATIKNTLIGVGGRGDCRQAGQNDSVTDTRTAAAVTVDGGDNLDQNGDCGLSASNGNLTGDPLLTSLGNFGGPTKTDAILTGSPAIHTGSGCAGVDQRGFTRPETCDIGAFAYIPGAQASFTYSPRNPVDSGGDNGGFVTFTNTSTTSNNASLSYLWDFGDGTTSTGANPGHGFSAPDHPLTYLVTLQATDSAGSVDQSYQEVTVRPANEQPIASFTFGAAAPNTPVHFDASASNDPDGSIVSYDWSWGDDSDNSSGVARDAYLCRGGLVHGHADRDRQRRPHGSGFGDRHRRDAENLGLFPWTQAGQARRTVRPSPAPTTRRSPSEPTRSRRSATR